MTNGHGTLNKSWGHDRPMERDSKGPLRIPDLCVLSQELVITKASLKSKVKVGDVNPSCSGVILLKVMCL